jgi:sirohydrochlorin cobaltochelatase
MELDQLNGATPLGARARMIAVSVAVGALAIAGATGLRAQDSGILLLAHGGDKNWNTLVNELAARVNERVPIEVAFGMADRATMQAAVSRLTQRGVGRIVAVPLFVSSHSSVIESSQYLLGARAEAPPALALFAKMHHGTGAAAAAADHSHHTEPAEAAAPADGTRPVDTDLPIRVTAALDHDPVVAEVLLSRARAISRDPTSEVVVLVAHGPTSNEENRLWLNDMEIVAGRIGEAMPFAGVESLTVRDDAPTPVRDAAAAHLREVVGRASSRGHRVLIVPLLLAYGGIEKRIRERLAGLPYEMAAGGLLPDDRLASWVEKAAAP